MKAIESFELFCVLSEKKKKKEEDSKSPEMFRNLPNFH